MGAGDRSGQEHPMLWREKVMDIWPDIVLGNVWILLLGALEVIGELMRLGRRHYGGGDRCPAARRQSNFICDFSIAERRTREELPTLSLQVVC